MEKNLSSIRETYAAIFGRFAPGRQAEPPADEVLVGRDGERSYLVDLLISTGKQGAYLVTGRRGAGKTSFVERCVDDYEASVFKRFLRADVGRGIWDRLALTAILAAVLVALFLLADLASMLARVAEIGLEPNPNYEGRAHTVLLWLLAAPITALLLWPIVYSFNLLRVAIWDPTMVPSSGDRIRHLQHIYNKRGGDAKTLLLLLAVAVGLWITPRMSEPTAYVIFLIALSVLFFASYSWALVVDEFKDWKEILALSYLAEDLRNWVQCLVERPFVQGADGTKAEKVLVERQEGALPLHLILSLLSSSLLVALIAYVVNYYHSQPSYLPVVIFAVVSCCATGVVIRSVDQAFRLRVLAKKHALDNRPLPFYQLATAMRSGALRYFIGFLGGIGLLVVLLWTYRDEPHTKIWLYGISAASLLLATLQIFLIRRFRARGDKHYTYKPPVRSLLFIKAAFCIVLASQLALPALVGICLTGSAAWGQISRSTANSNLIPERGRDNQAFVGDRDNQTPEGDGDNRTTAGESDKVRHEARDRRSTPTLLSRFVQTKKVIRFRKAHETEEDVQPEKSDERYSLFSSTSDTSKMMTGVLAVLLMFYFLEYEWIIRPQISGREDRLSDPADRPLHEDGLELLDGETTEDRRRQIRVPRDYFRRLAETTLPWAVYRVWLPVLVVRVNLGFDRLDHRRVIHAMLVGLRESYNRIFLAWNSPLGNIRRLFLVIVALSLTTMIDDAWLKLPKVDQLDQVGQFGQRGQGDVGGPNRRQQVPDDQQDVDLQTPGERVAAGKPPFAASFCEALSSGSSDRRLRLWRTACDLGGELLVTILYFDLLETVRAAPDPPDPKDHFLLRLIFPYQEERVSVVYRERPAGIEDSRTPHQAAGGFAGTGLVQLIGSPFAFEALTVRRRVLLSPGPTLCLYHVLILFAVFLLLKRLSYTIPIIPYGLNLRRIDDVLDSLSATRRVTKNRFVWQPAAWLYGFFGDPQESQTETAPLDPRTVEIAFLAILKEIQYGGLRLPGSTSKHLSFPVPELTFVFDELDKLGSRPDPRAGELTGAEGVAALHAEQVRSLALRSLLSDLKNLLSSASARFIFVGGRNLYDEWLADQTARQPLLTNIFNAVVYLPSLLADYGNKRTQGLQQRIAEYLYLQNLRAQLLFYYWVEKRWTPGLGLGLRVRLEDCFVQDVDLSSMVENFQLCVVGVDRRQEIEKKAQSFLTQDFIRFLTYRSMGNPKKLKELLASFVRPAGRVMGEVNDDASSSTSPPNRWSVERFRTQWPCRHVLRFGDAEIFRIQLLNDIYRHLIEGLENRLTRRDDKLATSVLFLVDFLFKFHRRAFSWSNLERVDELIHIHRAPDLRAVLERIVQHSSERYLHRVLNGMYSYRFRGDVARELEYLSKQSPQEMAAFNFTLDESQALKALFGAAINSRKDASSDLLAGLGELYEFDQEFETARHYYSRSIDVLDEGLEATVSGTGTTVSLETGQDESAEHEAFATDGLSSVMKIAWSRSFGPGLSRLFITWSIRRLRMMLQIGMTYEQARNIELAEAKYQSCRALAQSTLLAMVDSMGRTVSRELDGIYSRRRADTAGEQANSELNLLKHMNILFQPAFARAWAVEKLVVAIDTSVSIIEEDLWTLRCILPFVRNFKCPCTDDPANVKGSSFSLIFSQLHNKAGDLYFLKGKARILPEKLDEVVKRDGKIAEGYLLKAHYHYAVSLHEVRRYMGHRRNSELRKFRISSEDEQIFQTGNWPDFIYRAVGSGLCDISESMLARVSFFSLWGSMGESTLEMIDGLREHDQSAAAKPEMVPEMVSAVTDAVVKWIETDPPIDLRLAVPTGTAGKKLDLGTIHCWFGVWRCPRGRKRYGRRDSSLGLLRFEKRDSSLRRLVVSLLLSRAGARIFHRGGYPEDAARELIQVAETVETLLCWLDVLRSLPKFVARSGNKVPQTVSELLSNLRTAGDPCPLVRFMIRLAVDALQDAEKYFELVGDSPRLKKRSDPSDPAADAWKIGDRIPAKMLTVAIGLRLRIRRLVAQGCAEDQFANLSMELSRAVERWTGSAGSFDDESVLVESLTRHRYPMLNRLRGLMTLMAYQLIERAEGGDDATNGSEGFEYHEAVRFLKDAELFNGPFHFVPLHVGLVSCMLSLSAASIEKPDHNFEAYFREGALRELRRSREMYTMQRSYYDEISDMYYLYDDFNDRQLHLNHAIQMCGGQIACVLEEVMKCASRREQTTARNPAPTESSAESPLVEVGLERIQQGETAAFGGKRLGLIVHSASVTAAGEHAIDVFREQGLDVVRLFTPEHGLRGQAAAGEKIEGGLDEASGLPIVSLYGQARRPAAKELADLDALVLDLQGGGVRFYTYVSTMILALEAAADAGIEFIVLDRPNPLGGERIEGPISAPRNVVAESFVNMAPGPLVHGLTLGEMARYVNAQRSEPVNLRVLMMRGWTREMTWADTGRPWIPPSPNLRSADAALAYPGIAMFEATNVSEGRGTPEPFLVFGAPWLDREGVEISVPAYELRPTDFTPRASAAAPEPKYLDEQCQGFEIVVTDPQAAEPYRLGLALVHTLMEQLEFRWQKEGESLVRLLGTRDVLAALKDGAPVEEIVAGEAAAHARWREERRSSLLY